MTPVTPLAPAWPTDRGFGRGGGVARGGCGAPGRAFATLDPARLGPARLEAARADGAPRHRDRPRAPFPRPLPAAFACA